MTKRQTEKYGPMLFDASDYTRILKQRGIALRGSQQAGIGLSTTRLQAPFLLSPGDLVSAALGTQACLFMSQGKWCKLPTLLSTVVSPTGNKTPVVPPAT